MSARLLRLLREKADVHAPLVFLGSLDSLSLPFDSKEFLDEHGYCKEEYVDIFLENINKIIPADNPAIRCFNAALLKESPENKYATLRRIRNIMGSYRQIGDISTYAFALRAYNSPGDTVKEVNYKTYSNITKIALDKKGDANTGIGIDNPRNEFLIGKFLNTLDLPTFAYVFGLYNASTPLIFPGGNIMVSSINIPVVDDLRPYVVMEDIKDAVSFYDFSGDFKNTKPSDLVDVFLQIILGLDIAQREAGFVHFDLHGTNILIQRGQATTITHNGQKYYFKHRAVIIDYGTSRIRTPNLKVHFHANPSYQGVFDKYYGDPNGDVFYPRADLYKIICAIGVYLRSKGPLLKENIDIVESIYNMVFQDSGLSFYAALSKPPSIIHVKHLGADILAELPTFAYINLDTRPLPADYIYNVSKSHNNVPPAELNPSEQISYYQTEKRNNNINSSAIDIESILATSKSNAEKIELIKKKLASIDTSYLQARIVQDVIMMAPFSAQGSVLLFQDAIDKEETIKHIMEYFNARAVDYDGLYSVHILIQAFRIINEVDYDYTNRYTLVVIENFRSSMTNIIREIDDSLAKLRTYPSVRMTAVIDFISHIEFPSPNEYIIERNLMRLRE